MMRRFTIDGSEELEARLARTCAQVADRIRPLVPQARLEALVLGGGYGRGQGGVLRTESRDAPYNDLEFYLFLRGNRLLNTRRYARTVMAACEALSPAAGLHVECKVDSLAALRSGPVSMFSYDLVSGHRVVIGGAAFAGCGHHLEAGRIPLAEATRLLWNRCSGLLLAERMLRQPRLGPEEEDFIGRNLAKAWLAFGDAVLTACGQYHWSCLERRERLARLELCEIPPQFEQICRYHAAGVEFKLHPRQGGRPRPELKAEHAKTNALAERLWLWLEGKRLAAEFGSSREYACSELSKRAGAPAWRNLFLSIRTFGWRGLSDGQSWRYPRERLLRALPLLLWDRSPQAAPVLGRLQELLGCRAAEWDALVRTYVRIWSRYG